MNTPSPIDDAAFGRMMERIDDRLAAQRVPIPSRAFRAILEVGRELGRSVTFGARHLLGNDPSGDDDWQERVSQWYERRFGNRTKHDFRVGQIALVIRHDVWPLKVPLLYGRFAFFCGRTVEECAPPPGADQPHFNVLDYVGDDGLPWDLRRTLADVECLAIRDAFQLGIEAFGAVGEHSRLPLVGAALANHRAAAEHLIAARPEWGQAAWNALEALEKMLKAYIDRRGETFPQNHKLAQLARLAAKAGMVPLPDDLLSEVQFSPGIRYREEEVTMRQAVKAHHASLKGSLHAAQGLTALGKP